MKLEQKLKLIYPLLFNLIFWHELFATFQESNTDIDKNRPLLLHNILAHFSNFNLQTPSRRKEILVYLLKRCSDVFWWIITMLIKQLHHQVPSLVQDLSVGCDRHSNSIVIRVWFHYLWILLHLGVFRHKWLQLAFRSSGHCCKQLWHIRCWAKLWQLLEMVFKIYLLQHSKKTNHTREFHRQTNQLVKKLSCIYNKCKNALLF